MSYIPDLIPKEHKVLPAYFKPSNVASKTAPTNETSLYFILSIILFISAVFNFNRFFFALPLAFAGFIFTPMGKRWLEKQGRFNLTSIIRLTLGAALFVLCVPLFSYYEGVEAEEHHQKEVRHQQALVFTRDSLQKDSIRQDSLRYYASKSLKSNPEVGLRTLLVAEHFTATDSDRRLIEQTTQIVQLKLAQRQISEGHYKQALTLLDTLNAQIPEDPEILYQRALCHMHVGQMGMAAGDLAIALNKGSLKAKKLYNKVNPIRRRVIGYTTLCSDGSTSSASGRGACSWHGGVADWNHPIYEESRKYPTE